MKIKNFLSLALTGYCSFTLAQVWIQTGEAEIQVGNGVSIKSSQGKSSVTAKDINTIATDGSTASVTVGGIGEGVEMQGVAVINGRVYVDGKEVPPNVSRYKSPRTGEVYLIRRSKEGVSVTTEGSRK